MKPIPPMIAAIFLALIAALVACHLALISDLLMVTTFPAPADASRRSLADARSEPDDVADAVHRLRQTLAHAMVGIKFID